MRVQSADSSQARLAQLRSLLERGDGARIDPRLQAAARAEARQRAALERSWGEEGRGEPAPSAAGWEDADPRLAASRQPGPQDQAERGGGREGPGGPGPSGPEAAAYARAVQAARARRAGAQEAAARQGQGAEDPRAARREPESGAFGGPQGADGGRNAQQSREQVDLSDRLKRLRDEVYAPRPLLESDYASRALSDGARSAGVQEARGEEGAGDPEMDSSEEMRALDEVGRAPPQSAGPAPREGRAEQAERPAPRQAAPQGSAEGVERYAVEPQPGSLAAHLKRLREEVYNGGTHPSDVGRAEPAAQSAPAAPAQQAQQAQQPQPQQPAPGPQLDPSRWAASTYAQPEPQPQQPAQEQRRSPLMALANAFIGPFVEAKRAFLGGVSSTLNGGRPAQEGQGTDPRASQTQRAGQEAQQQAGQLLEPAPTHQLNT